MYLHLVIGCYGYIGFFPPINMCLHRQMFPSNLTCAHASKQI